MVHRNAPLSETGRLRLARCVVEDAWPLRRAASGSRSRTRRQPGGRSRDFADALGPAVKHKRTRPYRPQTNGKVETFHRTLADE